MSHTSEQEKIVLKVLSYKPHQYYEILAVEKSASDGEIKKSYRKLAIKLHPDKNPHPRASEAFKLINKAWGVLGDESKKRIFDQTGSDPDSRFLGFSNSGSTATSSGYARQNFDGAFQDDIFNMFFGGTQRAGGPTFAFGNNGFTFHSFGGDGFDPFTGRFAQQQQRQRQRAQARQQDVEPSLWDTVKQLAPILVILLATLISSFFSGESTPEYLFTKTPKYSVRRKTPQFKIPFYVGDKFAEEKSALKLRNFDAKVESLYVQDKRARCSREQVRKNDLMEEAQGWFYTDQRKLREAEEMPMPNCQVLRDLGIL